MGSLYSIPEHILVLKIFWLDRLTLDSVQSHYRKLRWVLLETFL